MSNSNGGSILNAACFQLGILGSRVTETFAGRVAGEGLTPKQVGLLAVVDAGLASSQRDIASLLRVAPSLVVALADQLVDMGAVRRRRSDVDRRVQIVELTEFGEELLATSVGVAQQLDREMFERLSGEGRAALGVVLAEMGK